MIFKASAAWSASGIGSAAVAQKRNNTRLSSVPNTRGFPAGIDLQIDIIRLHPLSLSTSYPLCQPESNGIESMDYYERAEHPELAQEF